MGCIKLEIHCGIFYQYTPRVDSVHNSHVAIISRHGKSCYTDMIRLWAGPVGFDSW